MKNKKLNYYTDQMQEVKEQQGKEEGLNPMYTIKIYGNNGKATKHMSLTPKQFNLLFKSYEKR